MEFHLPQWLVKKKRTFNPSAWSVIEACVNHITERWGDGGPESKLLYHSFIHTAFVVMWNLHLLIDEWNKKYIDAQITGKEEELLYIAVAGHDWEQAKGSGANEKESAKSVCTVMVSQGFGDNESIFVQAGILSTIVSWIDGKIVQPMTDVDALLVGINNFKRIKELAKLVADADLGALGQSFEDFWYKNGSLNLFYELRESTEGVTRAEVVTWLTKQYEVVKGHQWLSEIGELVFPHKMALLEEIKRVIGQIENDQMDLTNFLKIRPVRDQVSNNLSL